MAGQKLEDEDYAVLADFRHALRQFLAFSEARATQCGLTPQQHQALLAIRAAPAAEVTIGYVAERLLVRPHSASGLVDRLELLGLVERRSTVDDRRRALVSLTPRALSLLAELTAPHRNELRRLRPMLTELLGRLS